LNLPITSIRDLHVKNESLIAATHGRSFWMIDDLGPVRQMSKDVVEKGHHLYQPKATYRMAQSGGWRKPNLKLVGENHPNGVLFNFFVKDYSKEKEVTLRIEDTAGNEIQRFSSKTKDKKQKLKVKAENNRFVWNMRYKGFKDFEGMILYSSPNVGPKAVPGKYVAILSIGEEESKTEFEIVKDPRMPNTSEDYQKQLDYLLTVRDKVSEAHQAIIDIRSIKSDIDYFSNKLKDNEQYVDFLAKAKKLKTDLSVIENNIHMTKNQSRQDPLNYGIRINNRLAFLLADQQRGDYPPTNQAEEARQAITKELDVELGNLNTLLKNQLRPLNEQGKELGVQIISNRLSKLSSP